MKLKIAFFALLVGLWAGQVSAQKSAFYLGIGTHYYGETQAVLTPAKHANFYNSPMRTDMGVSFGHLYRFGKNNDMELQIGLSFYGRNADFTALGGVSARAKENYLGADFMFNLLLPLKSAPQLNLVAGVGVHAASALRQFITYSDGQPTEKATRNVYEKFAPKLQCGLRYAVSPAVSLYGMVGVSMETKALSITKSGQRNFFYYPVSLEFGISTSLGRKGNQSAE